MNGLNQKIAYTLNTNYNLGCFPECVVIDNDNQNKPSTSFIKINRQNIERYRKLLDSKDDLLINCCFQLEKEIIVSKITDRDIHTWDNLSEKYFEGKYNNSDIQYVRDYIINYINQYLNKFFENVGDKKLYSPIGKFPFMWKQLYLEMEMPEVYYCFKKEEDGLYFSLDFS